MYRNYHTNSPLTKTMTEDQFERVVSAIVSGQYSWACLLILSFAGYNPLHYIPHRTYNRLMKSYRENKFEQVEEISVTRQNSYRANRTARKSPQKLKDLAYMEKVDCQSKGIKGGTKAFYRDLLPNFI